MTVTASTGYAHLNVFSSHRQSSCTAHSTVVHLPIWYWLWLRICRPKVVYFQSTCCHVSLLLVRRSAGRRLWDSLPDDITSAPSLTMSSDVSCSPVCVDNLSRILFCRLCLGRICRCCHIGPWSFLYLGHLKKLTMMTCCLLTTVWL